MIESDARASRDARSAIDRLEPGTRGSLDAIAAAPDPEEATRGR